MRDLRPLLPRIAVAAGGLLILGVAIALIINALDDRAEEPRQPVARPDIVRPVRFHDFRLPELRIWNGDEVEYRYRDPDAAWSDEDVERFEVDLEAITVDIVTEKNRELLMELLEMDE